MADNIYAVYDKDTGEIINVIVYDGIAKYDETVFHGSNTGKVLLGKTNLDENAGIGNKYINGKFEKVGI